ncbi:MAG: TRAM domain-containing protein [Actinomycetota bacterium]
MARASDPVRSKPDRDSPRGVVLVELVRLAIVALFVAVGYQVGRALASEPDSATVLVCSVLGGGTGYVSGGILGRAIGRLAGQVERRMVDIEGADLVSGSLGAIAGVLLGSLGGWPLLLLPSRAVGLPVLGLLLVVLGFLGFRLGVLKREDLLQLVGLTYRTRASDLRVLDTSGVLDARLIDFVRAGVLRGTLLVPQFVLEEAQGIADSSDPVRRRRARRGLESLAAIRREGLLDVREVDREYPEYEAVDAKVVALARDRGAAIVTDDAALASVAEVQGIEVLLLRRIAAALHPPVLPGESVAVEITRPGRESGQGVGYLEDGTMVVVDHADGFVGHTIDVIIERTVQTSGGQMLFARIAEEPGVASVEAGA